MATKICPTFVGFTVTRRKPDGWYIVEISKGNIDYAPYGKLEREYPEDHVTFRHPDQAVKAAITLAKKWETESKHKVFICMGYVHGLVPVLGVLPLGEETEKELLEHAKEIRKLLPQCDGCNTILSENRVQLSGHETLYFCMQKCAENWLNTHTEEEV